MQPFLNLKSQKFWPLAPLSEITGQTDAYAEPCQTSGVEYFTKLLTPQLTIFKFFTKQFNLLPPPPHSSPPPNLQNQKIENNSLLESSEFWLNLQNRKNVYIQISFKMSVVSWLTLQGL